LNSSPIAAIALSVLDAKRSRRMTGLSRRIGIYIAAL
jgi:hypothetical protein